MRIAFSPDGERILVVGDENVVSIYDLFEATLRFSFPGGPDSFGGVSIWSPDGKQIAGAHSAYPGVKIWDASSGEELIKLNGHEALIWALFWSPSGDSIASVGEDQTIRIWDAETGEQKLVFSKHTDITISAIWSPDSSQIASSDLSSGKAIIWNPLTGEERLTFSAIPGLITTNAWSPDGKRILSTGAQGKALIWDSATGQVLLDLFPQDFELDIFPGGWTKDGKRVLVQSSDGTIHIFDATNGKVLSKFPTHQGAWNFLTLSPSEQRLLKGGDGGARVYDVQTGAELFHYPVLGWTDITYSPDGSQILVGSNYGTLEIYPTWHSVKELIAYAKSCCVLRELTPEERDQFGLPPLGE